MIWNVSYLSSSPIKYCDSLIWNTMNTSDFIEVKEGPHDAAYTRLRATRRSVSGISADYPRKCTETADERRFRTGERAMTVPHLEIMSFPQKTAGTKFEVYRKTRDHRTACIPHLGGLQ